MTGRKRDEFAWAHVQELDKGWRCNYCGKKFGGGVDKIKRHLAGAGQISECADVPKYIADEARRLLGHRKRKFENNDVADPSDQETMRNSAVVASTVAPPVQIPSSSTPTTSLPSLLTNVEGSENIDCVDGSVSKLHYENLLSLYNPGSQSAPQEVCNNAIDVAPTVAPLVQFPSSSTPTTSIPSSFSSFTNLDYDKWSLSLDNLGSQSAPQEVCNNAIDVAPTLAPLVQIPSSSTPTTSLSSFSNPDYENLLSLVNPGSQSAQIMEVCNNAIDVAPTTISNSLGSTNHGGLGFPNTYLGLGSTELVPSSTCTELGTAPTLESIVPCSSQNDQDHLIEENSGCTVMVYNLNQQRERTLGFYSLKGFLFAKAPAVLSVETIRDVYGDLIPSLYNGTVMHFMGHGKYGWSPTDQVCDLSDHGSNSNWTDNDGFAPKKCSCLGHEIERTCLEICKESAWAWDLINKAEQVYQLLGKLNESRWFYKTLERGGFKELPSGERENPISRFLSIFLLQNDLMKRVPELLLRARGISLLTVMDLEALIIKDSTFWEDGRELKRALSPILKIPYLIDTLVPAAGYLEMYMREANDIIFKRDPQLPKNNDIFWSSLGSYLIGIEHIARRRPIATYLNPAYLWSGDPNTILQLKRTVEARLPNLVGKSEFADIKKELELYGDQFRSPFGPMFMTLKSHHPLKLWQQYGNVLPHLRNFAIQELSKPVSCMSNQVKKHMNECKAAEGDIFQNLNLRMSNEFRDMGEDIYKTVGDVSQVIDLTDADAQRPSSSLGNAALAPSTHMVTL